MDTWQFYVSGRLARVEKDENADGKCDLKLFYENEKREKLLKDADYDGHSVKT